MICKLQKFQHFQNSACHERVKYICDLTKVFSDTHFYLRISNVQVFTCNNFRGVNVCVYIRSL